MNQDWEIAEFLEARENRLHVSGTDTVALVGRYGTPLFVYSEPRIRHNIDRLRKAGEQIGCPLKLCYAAKAISTLGILRAIKEAGCDIEVNSGGELWKALHKSQFTGDQIIFNGTSKEEWELRMAVENEIYAIQVDSMYELWLIEGVAAWVGKKANVSLRLVPEISSNTHSGLQTALLTSKFGMMPDEAYEAFRQYGSSEHLNLCGIHLHIGSQNPEESPYTEAFVGMFESLLRVYRETGIRLQHINLGGGFPVNYLRDRSHADEFQPEQFELFTADFEPADAIARAWQAARERAAAENALDLLESITLLLEPGRSIVGDAGVCLTTVRNRKKRPVAQVSSSHIGEAAESRSASLGDDTRQAASKGETERPKITLTPLLAEEEQREKEGDSHADDRRGPGEVDTWLLTDAGFNILLSMETYKWYYHLISAERADAEHATPYKLAGPLCDGGDVYFDIEGRNRLPDYRLLPENVEPGEILALLNCGAYSLAQASQYNGRGLPAVVLIRQNGDIDLIRKREEFIDLIANDCG